MTDTAPLTAATQHASAALPVASPAASFIAARCTADGELLATGEPLEVLAPQVVMQEVPGEISLAFTVLGCPHRCRGCHSVETWHNGWGDALSCERLAAYIKRYQGFISCVCFLGGDWQPLALLALLQQARQLGLKTCLYAGTDTLDNRLLPYLDYLKLGAYVDSLGGLDVATTNQRFYRLPEWQLLNHLFQKTR